MRKAPALLSVILALAACDQSGEAESSESQIAKAPATRTPRRKVDPRTPVQESVPTPSAEPAAEEVFADPAAPPIMAEVIEPDRPRPPSDYGLVQPSDGLPDDDDLTHHALAGYEVVTVYDKPDTTAPRLGYLRLGARTKVTAKVSGKGCSKSWYELPQGGYACSGRGLVVEKSRAPFMKFPPKPPKLDQAFPYDYAFVKRWNSPMWWRIPTANELTEASKQRRVREAKREGKPLPAAPVVAVKPAAAKPPAPTPPVEKKVAPAVTAKAPKLSDLPDPDGKVLASANPAAKAADDKPKPTAKAKPPVPAKPAAVAKAAEPAVVEPEPKVDLPLNPLTPWLERGFFVSLGEQVKEEGKSWWRTARGGYVDASHAGKFGAKDFSGAVLEEGTDFPFGYVMVGKGSRLLELGDDGKLRVVDTLPNRTFVDLTEETEIGGTTYMITADGHLVKKGHIRMAEPQQMPEGLKPWERWVDVSLSKQMLIAYEGDRPVFVTLVSSGKKGTKEEPFDTPTGRWRIRSKHVSYTMDGGSPTDGNYSIQDVPWTMFFEGSYALHGAFWHEGFGRVRSHGCVNLGPSDARWLFFWTTPYLPKGWHGVNAHDGSEGSTVVIHK